MITAADSLIHRHNAVLNSPLADIFSAFLGKEYDS